MASLLLGTLVLGAITTVPIPSHDIEARLELPSHGIVATDRIKLAGSAPSFELNRGLRVVAVEADGVPVTDRLAKSPEPGSLPHLARWILTLPKPAAAISIRYEGSIHDPVHGSGEDGEHSTGTIGEAGVMLVGSTG